MPCEMGNQLFQRDVMLIFQGDTNGNTALHYCVICDDGDLTTEICRYMMRYRLNVNETNKYGHTPASLALYLGKKEALQSLIDLVGKDFLQYKVLNF